MMVFHTDKKKTTMDEEYGDGSDHECCVKCGYCITCGDCKKFGCGKNRKELTAEDYDKWLSRQGIEKAERKKIIEKVFKTTKNQENVYKQKES